MACGYNNYIREAKIQNGLRPVNNVKNKVFFFLVLVLEQREKRKDNLVIRMNRVMTTDDGAVLIYFWEKVEVLNKQSYVK